MKFKKITRKESSDVSRLYDKQIYDAETYEELKAVLNDFFNYYDNMLKLPELEEEHSLLSNKKQEAYDFFTTIYRIYTMKNIYQIIFLKHL